MAHLITNGPTCLLQDSLKAIEAEISFAWPILVNFGFDHDRALSDKCHHDTYRACFLQEELKRRESEKEPQALVQQKSTHNTQKETTPAKSPKLSQKSVSTPQAIHQKSSQDCKYWRRRGYCKLVNSKTKPCQYRHLAKYKRKTKTPPPSTPSGQFQNASGNNEDRNQQEFLRPFSHTHHVRACSNQTPLNPSFGPPHAFHFGPYSQMHTGWPQANLFDEIQKIRAEVNHLRSAHEDSKARIVKVENKNALLETENLQLKKKVLQIEERRSRDIPATKSHVYRSRPKRQQMEPRKKYRRFKSVSSSGRGSKPEAVSSSREDETVFKQPYPSNCNQNEFFNSKMPDSRPMHASVSYPKSEAKPGHLSFYHSNSFVIRNWFQFYKLSSAIAYALSNQALLSTSQRKTDYPNGSVPAALFPNGS